MNKNLELWIIKTEPQKRTAEDIDKLTLYKINWFDNKKVAELLWRSEISIQIKRKRLHKKDNTYNAKHIDDKIETNMAFLQIVEPKSILDVYAWNCFYKWMCEKYITNDTDETKPTDFHLDSFEFLSKYYKNKFDLVDLDPFGSAFDCFDLAIKIADKWLIITLWELWHRRWKRLDFVKRYNITDINNDRIDYINNYIKKRGLIYKKYLTPVFIKDWNNIWRIYYTIEKFKETSQWE